MGSPSQLEEVEGFRPQGGGRDQEVPPESNRHGKHREPLSISGIRGGARYDEGMEMSLVIIGRRTTFNQTIKLLACNVSSLGRNGRSVRIEREDESKGFIDGIAPNLQ